MKELAYVSVILILGIGLWFAIPVFAIVAGTGLAALVLLEAIKDGHDT